MERHHRTKKNQSIACNLPDEVLISAISSKLQCFIQLGEILFIRCTLVIIYCNILYIWLIRLPFGIMLKLLTSDNNVTGLCAININQSFVNDSIIKKKNLK